MIQYEQGARFAQTVRDRAGGAAARQKDRAAERIGNVGGALDRAAEQLDSEEDRPLAETLHKAADSLRSLASSLADKDLASLQAQAEDAARNRPMLFLGAAFLGGLAAARFLRSEPPSQQQGEAAEPVPTGLEEPARTGEPAGGPQPPL